MLYAKTKTGGKDTQTPITAENVVSVCPKCGKEVQVDIAAAIKDKDCPKFDPFTADFLCRDCSQEWIDNQEPEEEDDEPDVDTLLAEGKYAEVSTDAVFGVLHANTLMNHVLRRFHRLEKMTGLGCPDIITTNEARMARGKLAALQEALDAVDETLRKLQLKTDHRSAEERLLEAVFGDKRKKKAEVES